MPDNTIDDFQFYMWAGAGNCRFNETLLQKLRQFGITGYYDVTTTWSPYQIFRNSADALAQNNMIAYPYCYGMYGFGISGHGEYPDHPFGPLKDTISDYTNNIYPPRIDAYRRYGVFAYCTCEENYIAREPGYKAIAWNNPEGMADYRRYLKEQFGDIGKLNSVWGTSCKDFSEITDEISFLDARKTGQYSRWLSQELHKVDRFILVHEETAKKIFELDPGSRVSVDCTGGMDFDWPRTLKFVTAGSQYPGQELNNNNQYFGTFFGAYVNQMDEYIMRVDAPWKNLFEGASHVTWWPVYFSLSGLGGAAAITPDISEPILAMKQASEEIAEIRHGNRQTVFRREEIQESGACPDPLV